MPLLSAPRGGGALNAGCHGHARDLERALAGVAGDDIAGA